MASFAININAYANLAPTQLGTLTLNLTYNQAYVFTVANFTTETIPPYVDPEGDPASLIKIVTIPTTGVLALNGVAVIASDEITVADITSNLLVYTADIGTTTLYSESFTFDIADVGSGLFGALTGTVSLNVAASVNLPPTEVGDGTETIEYAETLVFTRAMFTSGTTPPYADPEGDAALNLKIVGLPTDGDLVLNGVTVVLNQIIPFSQIDSGLFTFVPSLVDTDGDVETFQFEIADAGSGQFVS
tara:strand:+ start:1418 stop:2155 length:738 start_codon:yes stop_codon:yes gene_type:complete